MAAENPQGLEGKQHQGKQRDRRKSQTCCKQITLLFPEPKRNSRHKCPTETGQANSNTGAQQQQSEVDGKNTGKEIPRFREKLYTTTLHRPHKARPDYQNRPRTNTTRLGSRRQAKTFNQTHKSYANLTQNPTPHTSATAESAPFHGQNVNK
jgi:hypothetical protein